MNLFKITLGVCALALLAACNLDFFNGALSDPPAASDLVYEWNADNTIKYCYSVANGGHVLQWYEKYERDSAGKDTKVQHFNARDVLQWSKLFRYDSGVLVQEAYFDGSDALKWYSVFRYEAGKLAQTENYGGDKALQYVDQTLWTGDLPARSARFTDSGGGLALDMAVAYSYDAAGHQTEVKSYRGSQLSARLVRVWDAATAGGREIRQEAYGSQTVVSASLQGAAPASRALAAPASRALALPDMPAAPSVPALSLTDGDLALAWVRDWRYDAWGWFALARGADNYPVNLVRQDSRLPKKVDTSLSWETVGSYEGIPLKRITEKKTLYGSDVALDIKLGYDGAGWPNKVDLSGMAMLLPLVFTLDYNENHTPGTLKALQGTTQLYRLDFEYRDVTITVAPPATPWISIDPFNFTAGILKEIKNYDGDNNYLGKYAFEYNYDGNASLKVNSFKADGSANGSFILASDIAARKATFTSYTPDGAVVWYYEYGLDDLGNRISETKFDAAGAMQVIDSFDIQTLFR